MLIVFDPWLRSKISLLIVFTHNLGAKYQCWSFLTHVLRSKISMLIVLTHDLRSKISMLIVFTHDLGAKYQCWSFWPMPVSTIREARARMMEVSGHWPRQCYITWLSGQGTCIWGQQGLPKAVLHWSSHCFLLLQFSSVQGTFTASARGLTFTWWGCSDLCLWKMFLT